MSHHLGVEIDVPRIKSETFGAVNLFQCGFPLRENGHNSDSFRCYIGAEAGQWRGVDTFSHAIMDKIGESIHYFMRRNVTIRDEFIAARAFDTSDGRDAA